MGQRVGGKGSSKGALFFLRSVPRIISRYIAEQRTGGVFLKYIAVIHLVIFCTYATLRRRRERNEMFFFPRAAGPGRAVNESIKAGLLSLRAKRLRSQVAPCFETQGLYVR